MKTYSYRGGRASQRGVSLIVVLLLLLIMTLLGLASLRGTLMEERMSSNALDRGLAFQAAETALRQAQDQIAQAGVQNKNIGFNCDAVGEFCNPTPTNAYTGNVAGCVANAKECWINAVGSSLATAAGSPQYYIEFMDEVTTAKANQLGTETSANAMQYGGAGGVPISSFYRITARSNDPSAATNRAVVVLQTTIERK